MVGQPGFFAANADISVDLRQPPTRQGKAKKRRLFTEQFAA
jgi:hypothetical protein